jgi:short-subunit dehydrogenase
MANRNIELSANAAQKLRREVPGCQIEIVQLNLASLKSVKQCALQILAMESKIDLLINNAGEKIVKTTCEINLFPFCIRCYGLPLHEN